MRAMSKFDLHSIVYHEDEHYVTQCLNIDVSSFSDSEAEALANLTRPLSFSSRMPRSAMPTRSKPLGFGR